MEIYTDGSTLANGQEDAVGGWGVVILNEDGQLISAHSGAERDTTNNRMELTALLFAVKYAVAHPEQQFKIYSDSSYCVNIVNDWGRKWEANGWKRGKNGIVKNLDIVQPLVVLTRTSMNLTVLKVKGHAGVENNEAADKLCTAASRTLQNSTEKFIGMTSEDVIKQEVM